MGLNSKKKINLSMSIVASLMLTTAVLALIFFMFFMNGQKITTGEYPGVEVSESISCKISGLKYPVFSYDFATEKETTVNAVFNGDKIKSISLIQTMKYANGQDAISSEAINHADMGRSFSAKSVSDALVIKYSIDGETMYMSLYANGESLNSDTMKYFMIESDFENMEEYKENYEKQGFKCVDKK